MAEQKNITIPLNEKSEQILMGIIKKYKLEESDDKAFEKINTHKPFNESIVIQLTRDLMLEKISNKEFLDALYKELQVPKEKIKDVAIDVFDNLIPLLEKIPEDKLEEYNLSKQLGGEKGKIQKSSKFGEEQENTGYDKNAFKETLLQKVRGSIVIPEPEEKKAPMPNLKKVDVSDVEKNALNIQKSQIRPNTQNKPQEKIEEPKEIITDPYKESI